MAAASVLRAVSVRTRRHCHQIGILPEPHRGSNNYRHYTLAHVGTLLRIRRLVALGVLAAAGSNLADLERDASLVLVGLTGDTHQADLHSLSTALQQADRAGALSTVARHYEDLASDASAADVVCVVDELVTLLGEHLADFLASTSGQKIRRAAAGQVPEIHSDPRLNRAQAAVLRIFGDRLQRLIDDRDAGRAAEPGH